MIYKNYPRLRVLLSKRIKAYNAQLDYIDQLEASGQILVIRPVNPIVVGRMEKDTAKLEALYEEGFRLGEQFVYKHILK